MEKEKQSNKEKVNGTRYEKPLVSGTSQNPSNSSRFTHHNSKQLLTLYTIHDYLKLNESRYVSIDELTSHTSKVLQLNIARTHLNRYINLYVHIGIVKRIKTTSNSKFFYKYQKIGEEEFEDWRTQ